MLTFLSGVWAAITGTISVVNNSKAFLLILSGVFGGFSTIILKYWKYILVGLLVLCLALTGFDLHSTKLKLKTEKAAHAADVASYKKAQADANALAAKEKAELIETSKANAEQADSHYATLYNAYVSNLLRYKAVARKTNPTPSSKHSYTTEGLNGSSPSPEVLTGSINITMDDANICAINTARLQAAHDWALQLEEKK